MIGAEGDIYKVRLTDLVETSFNHARRITCNGSPGKSYEGLAVDFLQNVFIRCPDG